MRQNKLQLNISDETRILNMEGAKIKLSAADVKNRDALVFYDITTRSIPAQTTPSLVLLLPQAEEVGEEMENEPKMQVQMMVPLREAAKENGVECIIIKRPTDESGMTVSEVEKMILEWL